MRRQDVIVTIDGPAGAGKSTVARRLAERLGFDFLDTGAMYRVVTLAALRAHVPPEDHVRLRSLLDRLCIVVERGRTTMNDEDVSDAIRTPEVTTQVRYFADQPIVRDFLVAQQRAFAEGRNLVTEGRDQGTVVFPDAEFKFFVTASAEERARRRQAEFERQGRRLSFEEVLEDQERRDRQDQQREIAPLVPAPDAQIVDTTNLSIDDAIESLERTVRQGLEVVPAVQEGSRP